MIEEREQLKQILSKAELSVMEKEWLLNYIENTNQQELKNILTTQFEADVNSAQSIDPLLSNKILARIHQQIDIKQEPLVVRHLWARIAVAASIIGILSFGTYFYINKNNAGNLVANTHLKDEIKPIAEKAILALVDGSKLQLDKVKNGTVINQNNVSVLKTNGKLVYNRAAAGNTIAYNSLTTPRGGKYRVTLPDGTQVWLNSASSIKYPTAFTGDKRLVEITGEAYFEVTKNKKMPFVVKVNQSEVRVYGTHFNVMAYNDEAAIKTTLLEGSVKCTTGNTSVMLKPGEQSELEKNGHYKVSTDADVNYAVAWKEGMLHFKNADIGSVMRQLSRAYDFEVVYNKKTTNYHFVADISLNSPLSDVLKELELTGQVHFDITGKQVSVNP